MSGSEPNMFFLIFATTILLTRIFLYLRPSPSPTFLGFRLHHWMYGLVLIPIGLWLNSLILYAVGFGLFVDELAFLLIRGNSHKDNYSILSLLGLTFFVVAVFFMRHYLVASFF